ncbi:MAG: hypothetical protein CW716_09200, partial [Candidatus Bathyarchaeum sp.]
MLRKFLGENNISKCNFLAITILFVSVFGWYYMTQPVIETVLTNIEPTYSENLAIWATFYFSIIGASILGTFVSKKVSRIKFLYTWIAVGTIISLAPVLLTTASFEQILIVSLVLGASFGIGVPSFFAYFTECTVVENRGRIGSISFLIANISGPVLAILTANETNLVVVTVIFALVRGIGLTIFFLNPEKQISQQTPRNVSFLSVLRDRTFLLYFVAWSMFPLIDSFEKTLVVPHLSDLSLELVQIMNVLEPLVATLAILIGGIMCDWIGRKKIVLSGFVSLGAAYGVISFITDFEPLWYIYFVIDAIAWGLFGLIFFIIIWGDIAKTN